MAGARTRRERRTRVRIPPPPLPDERQLIVQKKIIARVTNGFVVAGALAYAALLAIELGRDNTQLPFAIFSAAMVVLCLAHMAAWLPASDAARVITRSVLVLVVGLTLAVSFTIFAVLAENAAQLALSVFVALAGGLTFVTEARRIKIRRIPSGAGEQR